MLFCDYKDFKSRTTLSQYVFCFNMFQYIYKNSQKWTNSIIGSPRQVTSMQTETLYVISHISWLHTLMVIFLETGDDNLQTKHEQFFIYIRKPIYNKCGLWV